MRQAVLRNVPFTVGEKIIPQIWKKVNIRWQNWHENDLWQRKKSIANHAQMMLEKESFLRNVI